MKPTRLRRLALVAVALLLVAVAALLFPGGGKAEQDRRDQVHTSNVDAFNEHCFSPTGDRVC